MTNEQLSVLLRHIARQINLASVAAERELPTGGAQPHPVVVELRAQAENLYTHAADLLPTP